MTRANAAPFFPTYDAVWAASRRRTNCLLTWSECVCLRVPKRYAGWFQVNEALDARSFPRIGLILTTQTPNASHILVYFALPNPVSHTSESDSVFLCDRLPSNYTSINYLITSCRYYYYIISDMIVWKTSVTQFDCGLLTLIYRALVFKSAKGILCDYCMNTNAKPRRWMPRVF